MNKERMTLAEYIQENLEEIGYLFQSKADQYATGDELANFRTGAMLMFGEANNEKMYEAGKSYMAKHIAFLYDHGIKADKAVESWGDVAVYALILKYMAEAEAVGIKL